MTETCEFAWVMTIWQILKKKQSSRRGCNCIRAPERNKKTNGWSTIKILVWYLGGRMISEEWMCALMYPLHKNCYKLDENNYRGTYHTGCIQNTPTSSRVLIRRITWPLNVEWAQIMCLEIKTNYTYKCTWIKNLWFL